MSARYRFIEAIELTRKEKPPATTFGSGIWTFNHKGTDFREILGRPEKYSQILSSTSEEVGWDAVFLGSGMNHFLGQAMGGRVEVGKSIQLTGGVGIGSLASPKFRDNLGVRTVWEAAPLLHKKTEVAVAATSWGPFTLTSSIVGMENFLIQLVEEEEKVGLALRATTQAIKDFYLPMQDYIDIASIAEPASSGDVISPEHFRRHSLPYLKELVDFFHSLDIKVILHICGWNDNRLQDIAGVRADCFSPGETTNLAKVKEIVGSKSCIFGNVAPQVLTESREKVVECAEENIFTGNRNKKGYVLSTGCDISPFTPIENVKTFIGTARSNSIL